MKSNYKLLFFCQLLTAYCLLVFCSCLRPHRSFESSTPPAAPDYSKQQYWAALPTVKDSADVVPYGSGLKDGQADAKVDVFFIYPTIYLTGRKWNADVNKKRLNKRIDKTTIMHQANVFNGSCKIYAPRYRLAVLYSYLDKKGNGKKALDFAYEDVKKAFEYYLKNYNNGRPFIIASHSQGSHHAFRLIKDYIENNPVLYKQLVCAYIVGATVEQDYTIVVPCDSASQTGCMISWRSAQWGTTEDKYFFQHSKFCTNPLSWKRDTVYVSAAKNLGGIPYGANRIDVGIADAKVSSNILWVHKPEKLGYLKNIKNYHISDYNLFWMNIRENVKQRVESYLQKNK